MSWLSRLLGKKDDPTATWPQAGQIVPEITLPEGSLLGLKFGDPLEAARPFGKPDDAQGTRENTWELSYRSSGFEMDFENDQLTYLGFLIAPDKYALPRGPVTFCQPIISGGKALTAQTTEQQLLEVFGKPRSVDRDEDETVLFYDFGKLTGEFELNPAGFLKRWNLYPT